MPSPRQPRILQLIRPFLREAPGLNVFDPASGACLGTVADMSVEEVVGVIVAAQRAFSDWAKLSAKQRSILLRTWHDLILSHSDELAQITTSESGKPLSESRAEVAYAASFIEWFAEQAMRTNGDVIPSPNPDKRILTIKQAVGVTAAITPWNFPLAMITRKAGPALAAGCPMIVKPAEATPLSALYLEMLSHKAGIPRDVFRVVTTNEPAIIGRLLTEHPIIKKVSFTGSTKVGKQLIAQSAATVKKVSMELGGNAPFIVFDDASISSAVDGAIASKFRNAGQTCICANRLLVQADVHDTFVQRLADRVATLKVGTGVHPETSIGPLINLEAVEKVRRLVEGALHQGATVRIGGAPHVHGPNFFSPTVLTGVRPEMEIANTEIFGPVAPIIEFDSEEDAIRIANDTPYGLAAYIYTGNISRMWRVMEALDCGMVGVNDTMISTEVAPFGGIKESGLGREGSQNGIDEYLELKYCLIGGL